MVTAALLERLQCKAGLETFFPTRVNDVPEKANLSRTAEKRDDRACSD